MSRIGLGLLTLALVLGACWLTPTPAFAQEDLGAAVEDAAAEVEETVEEVVEAVEDAVDGAADEAEAAAAAAAEAAAEELAAMDGDFFIEQEDEDADPVLKDGVEELMKAIPAGDMSADVFDAAVTAGVVDPYAEAGISPEAWMTNNLWIMIAGMLVFIMHLGFACVESGLTRAKNTVNILFKNVMIVMIGIVMYGVCGWLIMYPADWIVPNIFAFGFGIGGGGIYSSTNYVAATPMYNTGYTAWTDFFFQAMFAATCCTIVSGAVAGRVKLLPFLIFCVFFSGVVYPMIGSWQWGGGILAVNGFNDFAGSTLVHGVGGAGALAGALLLGPRLGKYASDGTVQPIPGHSMPLVAIGVFLLWFGWFGFNGGSELSADATGVSYVLVTTTFAACGGGIACAATSWIMGGKPDLTMALNGILAGLVGITAGPNVPSWIGALVICGFVPGVLCYFSVMVFDKLKIDDPVGAISVHGVCGIYGTLAVAFSGAFEGNFGDFGIQAIGAIAGFATAFVCALVLFGILKVTLGIRVSEAEEIEGLDLGEHDMSAYPDFQQTYIKSYHAREI